MKYIKHFTLDLFSSARPGVSVSGGKAMVT